MADDFSELYELAADLEEAPQNVAPKLATALGRTSQLIKKDAQDTVRGRDSRLAHAASAISYDLTGDSGAVSEMSSEIGYEKGGAGSLGNFIEFGASQIAPSHDLGNALLRNADDFDRGVANAVDDSLRESGL